MPKHFIITLCSLGLLAGCGQPKWAMGPPQKPNPHPEMSKLEGWVGSWMGTGTGEYVSPLAEKMSYSFTSGGNYKMVLGGMALKGEGWYETGDDERATSVEYWSWDPKAEKYRIWYFSDWGETGTGWAEFDENGKTMRLKARGMDSEGARSRFHGTQTFIDKNTMEWTLTQRGPHGKMESKGTTKRTR